MVISAMILCAELMHHTVIDNMFLSTTYEIVEMKKLVHEITDLFCLVLFLIVLWTRSYMPYYGSINIDDQERYNQQEFERLKNIQTVEFKFKSNHQNNTQKMTDL